MTVDLVRELVNWIVDSLLLLIFFSKVPRQKNGAACLLGIFFMLLVAPIYYLTATFIRISAVCITVIRISSYLGYLHFWKNIGWKASLFYAMVLASIMGDCQMLLMSSVFRDVRRLSAPFYGAISSTGIKLFISFTITIPIKFSIFLWMRKVICFDRRREIKMRHFTGYAMLLIIETFVHSALYFLEMDTLMNVFTILAAVFILINIAIEEGYEGLLRQYEENKWIMVSQQYQLEAMQEKEKMNENIRKIHHDMRNHLHTIEGLATEESIRSYVSNLLGKLKESEMHIHTGYPVLDHLLEIKMREVEGDNIQFSVMVDSVQLKKVEQFDMSILFGNALDNAIEAEMREEESKRRIELRITDYAEKTVIRLENYCTTEVRYEETIPVSTKEDRSQIHGIGYKNMLQVVDKYDGTMISGYYGDTHVFVLKIMI